MKNTKELCCLLPVMEMLRSLQAGCGTPSDKPNDTPGKAKYEIVFAHDYF